MALGHDKTISHFHTDPKLIEQVGAKSLLSVGQFVYLDYTDGFYKPAIATSEQTSSIQGIVWGFIGNDSFFLKVGVGPLRYRFPLTPIFFNKVNGRVDEYSPSNSFIPGSVGEKLYLSETVPGSMQANVPINFIVLVGYKTEYGMIYNPKTLEGCCFNSTSSSSSSMSCDGTNCVYTYDANYNCNNGWIVTVASECVSGGIVFDTGWIYDSCAAIRSVSISACCTDPNGCPEPPVVDNPIVDNVRGVCCP